MHNYKPEYARPMDMTVLPSGWYGNYLALQKSLFQPHLTLKKMDSFITGNGLVLTRTSDFMQSAIQFSVV